MTTVKLGPYIASQTDLSRRKVMELFKAKAILVNGKVPEQFTQIISPSKDKISINGKFLSAHTTSFVYYKFNKPWNVISTMDDPNDRRCIEEFISKFRLHPSVIPVGRLDRYTTGLMILTNHGELANRLLHPSYKLNKIYKVTIEDPVTKGQVKSLGEEIKLEDGPVRFTSVEFLSPTSMLVTLHEGRNRIVRRSCEALGLTIKKLKRISMGPIELGELKTGQVVPLKTKEVQMLLESTGILRSRSVK